MRLSKKSLVLVSAMFILGLFMLFSLIQSRVTEVKKSIETHNIYNLNE